MSVPTPYTYEQIDQDSAVQRAQHAISRALSETDDPIEFVFTKEFTQLYVSLGQARVRSILAMRRADEEFYREMSGR